MKKAAGAVIVVGLVLASSSGRAQPQPSDKDADAERLFREGQKLLEERRYGEACPKFEAAYRKDQQLGTLLNLAYCHKEQGAIWQSWLEFKEAEVKAIDAKRPERKEFAQKRMAELEKSPSLARVVVDAQQRVELTEILVEDRRVPEADKGTGFVVETGQRKFTFRARGKKQIVQLVSIVRGTSPQRIQVPEMDDQPKEPIVEPPPPLVVKPIAPPSAAEKPPPADKPRDGSGQKVAAFVAGGIGIVGIGIGGVFGLKTLNNPCTDGKPAEGLPVEGAASCTSEERDDASTSGTIATVAFIGGGIALATGVVLFLTAPSGRGPQRGGRS